MGDIVPRTQRKTKKRPSQKLQYIGLGLLAAVTFAVVGFVFLRPEPVAEPAPVRSVTAPATTQAAAPATDPAATLAAVKGMVTGADPIVISVLGDSTGNAKGEWVELWSQHLGQYGTVTLHQWDDKSGAWNPKPIVVPGPERSITIWNGSHPGANYMYALERLDIMQPEKPSFLIHSFGHNKAAQLADGGAMDLLATVDKKWGAPVPAVVVLQNPSQNAREFNTKESVEVLQAWAPRAGHPVIDVYGAFEAAGNLPSLLADDVHPNPAGQKIWVDTVIAALG